LTQVLVNGRTKGIHVKRDLIIAAIGILVVAGLAYGLDTMRPDLPLTPSQPFSAEAKSESAAPAKQGRIVMHVNGEPVDEFELNAFLSNAPEQLQVYFTTDEGRRLVAQEFVKLKVLEQEGRRRGYDRDPTVRTQIDADRLNVMARFTLRRLVGEPSEAELRAEFEKSKGKLAAKDISHILITYEGAGVPPRTGKPAPPAQALERAKRIASQAKKGADFAALARKESDDLQSANAGGYLGPVSEGSMPPELDAVVMKLAPGEISEPVRSQFGFHIFKAGETRTQQFEQVREALASQLQRKRAEQEMTRLEKAAKVELDPKIFPAPKGRS
jgi:hypothetical protein